MCNKRILPYCLNDFSLIFYKFYIIVYTVVCISVIAGIPIDIFSIKMYVF